VLLKVLIISVLSLNSLVAEVKEERVEYAGVAFRVVRLDPAQVEVVWKVGDGKLLMGISRRWQ